ncbi:MULTISPECIES: hypothetical protein [unclassified Klebsiella]|uniref:hypothetical protein n=1 Tax=unclassified Klebsiella TaxID=2608929 RepID=UPI0015DCA9CC|nr:MULTISPECIES: hypothetical protein [unclassified Klebsiella]BBR59357.1 hypothetical protein WP4W18E05_27250 [Klebsiella sp. WP4-W18-ESBL-05]BBT71185.1 hypothetical protein WP8S18E06_24840 [Klebsiella sp. WP8-S18-ESBL-06]
MYQDKIKLGDASKGIYTVYTRAPLLDFIISEPSSPNRVSRVEVPIDSSQFIGAFSDTSGKAVTLKVVDDAAKIAGVMLSAASSIAAGQLTTNFLDLKSAMLVEVPNMVSHLRQSILETNGFEGVEFDGGKFTCTGLTGATDDAQDVLDAVVKQLDSLGLILVSCGK